VASRYFSQVVPRRILPAGFVEPCIPTLAARPPSGPDWVHEIKHDGYRLIVRRVGKLARLFTRRGYDWTECYPAIAAAATKIRARSFTLDGEAVVCGEDGVAVFDALHRRRRVSDAILQAFDLLELDGLDYRPLPLSQRKDRLERLLARAPAGISLNEHTDAIGGPGGHCVEAVEQALSVRPVAGLAQDQEPGEPGDGETSGAVLVSARRSR
jgi:bifunctional non-homologous end joining protein LigD